MGFFSRNSSKTSKQSKRTTTSGQNEMAELRVRARRRLLGALILVLAAVIIVPQVFDSNPDQSYSETPQVVVAQSPARPDPDLHPDLSEPIIEPEDPELFDDIDHAQEALNQIEPDTDAEEIITLPPEEPQLSIKNDPEPESKPQEKPKQSESTKKSEEKPSSNDDQRTDDGSVALALLEGRAPEQIAQTNTQSGGFLLQIAAYGAESDANNRRDKLKESGVSNAYVEKTSVNGKTAFRLRVGPFPSHDAAQAAQARLRALGYDNSMILTQ